MAEQTPMDWLLSGPSVNPGVIDSDDLDDEVRFRHDRRKADAALNWLSGGRRETLPQRDDTVIPPEEGGILNAAWATVKDVGTGITELPRRAMLGGVRDALQETLNLGDSMADWLKKTVGDPGGAQIFDEDGNLDPKLVASGQYQQPETGIVQLPEVRQPETVTGNLARNAVQFITGFLGAGKLLKAVKPVGRAGKIAKVAGQGAIADFTVFNEHQERLANLIEEAPALRNPVTDYLAADEDDGTLEGRMKNAVEGLGLGVLAEGVMKGIRGLWAMRLAQQATTASKAKATKTVLEDDPLATLREARDLNLLGDREQAAFVTKSAGKMKRAAGETKLPVPDDVAAKGLTRSGVIGGDETYVNFARIDTPDDVKAVIGQMADAFKGDIDAARRGVRTHAQTRQAADAEDAWRVLMERRTGQPLNAEQALAARNLWTTAGIKLQEVAELAAKDPTPENLFQFRRMLAVMHAVQKEAIGARTETARALNAWAIPAGGDMVKFKGIMDAIEQTGGVEVSAELAKRIAIAANTGTPLSTIMRMTEKGAFAKTLDAVHEVWINGLLSGPKTHMVNMMSNASVVGLSLTERGVAARMSQFLGDEGVEIGEAMAQSHGLRMSVKDAFRNAAKSFRLGQQGFGINKIESPRTRGISSTAFDVNSDSWLGRGVDVLGASVNVPGRALMAEDEFFKTINYRGELHALAHRQTVRDLRNGHIANTPKAIKERMADLIDNPPESLHLQSQSEAAYNTFTSDPGPWTQSIMRLRGRVPGLRYIVPFVNTPGNILKYTFERTPLAPLTARYRAAIAKGGADAAIARSRMMLGSMAMMVTADFAMDGMITGSGPPRGPERDAWLRQGNRPYSIRVGDKWIAYNRLDPIGYIIGMSADMTEFAKNAEFDDDAWAEMEELGAAVVFSAAENINNKQYLQGFSAFVEAMSEPDRRAAAYLERFVGSFVPAVAGEVARQMDPVMRVSHDMMSSLKRRTPGLSDELPPRRDLWGRELKYESGIGTAYDVLSPMYGSSVKPEPIDEEMQRSNFFLGMPQKGFTIDGEFVSLKNRPDIHSRYLEIQGQMKPSQMRGGKAETILDRYGDRSLLETLNDIVTDRDPELSADYRELTDADAKEGFIQKIVRRYRDAAKEEIFAEFPELRDRSARIKARRLERTAE